MYFLQQYALLIYLVKDPHVGLQLALDIYVFFFFVFFFFFFVGVLWGGRRGGGAIIRQNASSFCSQQAVYMMPCLFVMYSL